MPNADKSCNMRRGEAMMRQTSIFDGGETFFIDKPIRLIEFFAGYGSQALALQYLDVPFEHWKIAEWAVKSVQAYKDLHFPDDNTDYSENKTFSELVAWLTAKGISANYNVPMTETQIKRLGEKAVRKIYNNIVATHNLVSVCGVRGEVSNALMTVQKDSLVAEQIDLTNCRVRKLTEKECFRLQGVKDDDFEKIAENQSRSSRYHLAGDSITSTVLMAIFGELLNMDYKSKIKDVVTDITKESKNANF